MFSKQRTFLGIFLQRTIILPFTAQLRLIKQKFGDLLRHSLVEHSRKIQIPNMRWRLNKLHQYSIVFSILGILLQRLRNSLSLSANSNSNSRHLFIYIDGIDMSPGYRMMGWNPRYLYFISQSGGKYLNQLLVSAIRQENIPSKKVRISFALKSAIE